MELHILGPLEIWSHGRRVGWGAGWREARTLFAELADPKADELREQLSGLSPSGAR